MGTKTTRAILLAGPLAYVLAKKLPPGQRVKLPLLLFGGAVVAWKAWQDYAKES